MSYHRWGARGCQPPPPAGLKVGGGGWNVLQPPQILGGIPLDPLPQSGFPATLEIRENLENEFPFFQSGKTQGIWEKHKKSGKILGICDSDPEGKGFCQFGVCVYCAMCPSCVHLLTGYSGFCEYYTPLQTITVGCPRTTS